MPDKMVVPASAPDGMTLRDYFAIRVLQGLIAAGGEIATTQKAHSHRNEKIAKRAVEVADALLKELGR